MELQHEKLKTPAAPRLGAALVGGAKPKPSVPTVACILSEKPKFLKDSKEGLDKPSLLC